MRYLEGTSNFALWYIGNNMHQKGCVGADFGRFKGFRWADSGRFRWEMDL